MCFDSITTHTAEAEYTSAKTAVWWDIENCPVPKGCWDAHNIAQKLNSALLNLNYHGPITISAYGNTDLIPKAVQQALSSTGISLHHVPSGKKDASDKKILVDMLFWVLENPAPANLMLISGDGDFSDALHRLRMRRYNILLAHPLQASPFLVASARTSWMWKSLLASCCSPTRSCSSFDSEISSQDVSVSVSERVLSTQVMDSGSGSSKAARKKLKDVLRELNQQETNRMKVQKKCSEVACKNIEEIVQESDLQSRDVQESMKCLEKQNKELMETVTTSERSGREFWQDFKERLDKNGVAPLNVDHVFSELSRDSSVPKEVRECFEAIFKKLEPTQNDIEIEKLEDMLKQGLEVESGELENAPAEPTKSDINMKKSTVTVPDKYEPYVCSICNVTCDHPLTFESHHKGRKHAAKLKMHIDDLLDNHQKQAIIQDNGLRKDMTVTEDKAKSYVCRICNVICYHPLTFESHHKGRKHAAKLKMHIDTLLDNHQRQEEIIQDNGLRKDMTVIEDKAEPYVCSICNVICDHPLTFESHHKGRKHAAKIKALLDAQQIQEETIQDNGLPKDMSKKLQIKIGEAPENIDYLDKQRLELEERFAISEKGVEEVFQTIEEVRENDYKSLLPNAECFYTELNPKLSAPKEARECIDTIFKNPEVSEDSSLTPESESIPSETLEINSSDPESSSEGASEHPEEYIDMKKDKVTIDAIFKKPEVSEDSGLTPEFESIPSENLEMNLSDPESSSTGVSEHPEEYMDMKKEKLTKDKAEVKAYVCNICSVICLSPAVFEAHLMGKKHAKGVKKHAEVLFDDKKILEQSLEEKDHPRDAVEDVEFEPKDAQVSIKEVTLISKARVDTNENELIPSVKFPEDKETSRERSDSIVKRVEIFMEKTSNQRLVESENAFERVEEVVGTWKENGAAQIRVCEFCNVMCTTQAAFDTHLAGKRHAAKTQIRVCAWCNVVCHKQVDFDVHMGGKKHAATLKKHMSSVEEEEVAVV